MRVHPSAMVEDGAALGNNVEIGPYAVVHAGATVGDGCRVGSHAVIYGSVTMGRDCVVHPHVVLGDEPQDLSFEGVPSYVSIGERCVFREFVTVHRGTQEGTTTVIGDDCLLMNCSHVGHNVQLGNRVILVNGCLLAGHVQVGDGAFLSGSSAVHQFCRVGRLAIMGGNSAATMDVPPFCMVAAVKKNQLSGLNTVGLRRAGFTPEERSDIKRAYRDIFQFGQNMREKAHAVAAETHCALVREMAEFVLSTQRGVCSHIGN